MTALKIITLNTWNIQGPWRQRWNLILSEIGEISPDIVAFQEIIGKDFVPEIAKKANFSHHVFSGDIFGLMILSRHPIEDSQCEPLMTRSPLEDRGRAALWIKTRIDGLQFAMINTHLSWRLEESDIRERQVDEIIGLVNRKFSSIPVIVTGDFNAPPQSPEIGRMISEGGFSDSYAVKNPASPGLTWDNRNVFTATHWMPDRRLDYIFYRDPKNRFGVPEISQLIFTQPNKDGIYPSDHYGVLTRFPIGSEAREGE